MVTGPTSATAKRSSNSTLHSCDTDNTTNAVSTMVLETAKNNLENVPDSVYIGPTISTLNETHCNVSIGVKSDTTEFPVGVVGAIVGGSLLVLALFLLLGYFIVQKKREWIKYYPKEFHSFWDIDSSWTKISDTCHSKEIKTGSDRWDFFETLWKTLDTEKFTIENVYQISNTILAASCGNAREILTRRYIQSPFLFLKRDWMQSTESEDLAMKLFTFERFNKLIARFSWNQAEETKEEKAISAPLVVVCHGTDLEIAWGIATNGFAALATIDAGYYGKGIYFTSYAEYTIPYCCSKATPCLIICLMLPGNPYPVTEHPMESPKTFMGKPTMSGYQSHYVVTTPSGMPVEDFGSPSQYDELVIGQEAQVVPLFIVKVVGMKKLMARYVKLKKEAEKYDTSARSERSRARINESSK